jgi:hypothetical protein
VSSDLHPLTLTTLHIHLKFEMECCVKYDPFAMNDRVLTPIRLCNLADHDFAFLKAAFAPFGMIEEIIVLPAPNFNKCFLRLSNCVEAFHAAHRLDGTQYRIQEHLNPEGSQVIFRSFYRMHVRFAQDTLVGVAAETRLREVCSRNALVGEAIEEGKRVREAWS